MNLSKKIMKNSYPDIQILEYIETGDFFIITKEYDKLAKRLGLSQWNSLTWIGRLISLDNDYGEHLFDNWTQKKQKSEIAKSLGYDSNELIIIVPKKFQNGYDGPCNTDEFRKTFWTDVFRSLKINLSTIIQKAQQINDDRKISFTEEFDEHLELEIHQILIEYSIIEEEEDDDQSSEDLDKLEKFTNQQIKEISNELLGGMKCYINKSNDEIKTTIDFSDLYVDTEFWQEDMDELENNRLNYFEIEKMSSREAFIVMENFVDHVKDPNLKDRLVNALNRRKPFQNFKYEVEDSEYREKWFEYRLKEQCKWVKRQLKAYESIEK